MHKYFKHYKIFKDKKVSGYTTYSHEPCGDFWAYIKQTSETVANGTDIEDGYIEEYGLQIRNYMVKANDILICEDIEYKVSSSTMIKGICYARVVREWQTV